MRLLLIRHGQTPDNVRGALGTTAPGVGLTDLGRRQARALPDALADESIGAVLVSNLLRTQLTAAPLAERLGLRPEVHAELREVIAGDLELKTDPVSVGIYLAAARAWVAGDLDVRVPGAEDGHEFFARYDAGIEAAVSTGHGTVAVVSHGAAIRAWACSRSENVDPDFVSTHLLENTGVVIVEGSFAEGWRLVEWAGLPVGGEQLVDRVAVDPTSESV